MTAIQLEDATVTALDQVVASGRFSSRDEAIRSALRIVREVDIDNAETLTPDVIAGIERGLADSEAGRVSPAEQVFAELRQRYQNWR